MIRSLECFDNSFDAPPFGGRDTKVSPRNELQRPTRDARALEIRLQPAAAANVHRRAVEASTKAVVLPERAGDRLETPVLERLNHRLFAGFDDHALLVERQDVH
jgi:hypothetical protein